MPAPIQGVVKHFNVKRTDNTFVFASNSAGTIRSDIIVEAPNGSDADAGIAQIVTNRRDAAQGNADELNTVLGLVG